VSAVRIDLFRPWRAAYGVTTAEKVARLVPAVLYAALIYGVSSIPSSGLPSLADDRILHFAEYFGFGICLAFAAAAWARERFAVSHAVLAALAGIAWAISDEWHQSFVPGRDPSLSDLLFDGVGLVAAQALILGLTTRGGRS
jgi:hypothetical protein